LREYLELVTESLKGSGVKRGTAAERLCQVFLPSELAEVVAQNDIGNLLEEVMSAARDVPAGGSDQELAGLLATHVKGLAIDVNKVRAHIISPQNIQGVFSDKGPTETKLKFTPIGPVGNRPEFLDVPAFGAALHDALQDGVAGYSAELRQHGQAIFNRNWLSAKRPQDGNENWTSDVQLHVASVCKLITAMAMTVLMAERGVSPDAQIIDYLPDYWAKGPNIEYIVFRNLFNHTSGIFRKEDAFDFLTMESVIASGISLDPNAQHHLGGYQYHNLNYGLFRILLTVMNGNISKSATFNILGIDLNDLVWDVVTIDGYSNFVQARIFRPSGVSGATLDHPAAAGLAYKEPGDTEHGWNSGNLEEICGSDGWHVSVNQLLDVMGEFRRGGNIVPAEAAQAMLVNGFGVDPLVNPPYTNPIPFGLLTPAGEVYCKPSTWYDGIGREEQALVYFLPQDMELAILANSEVAGADPSQQVLRDIVTQTYLDNLTSQLENA
jgi:CubicO group peptidase (beta-lactamase class C family)